jgi:hypothetical protein
MAIGKEKYRKGINKALLLLTCAVKTWQRTKINFGVHLKTTDILSNYSAHYTAASSGLVSARKSEKTKRGTEKELDTPCTYKRNTEARSRNYSCYVKKSRYLNIPGACP